jgi:hypothetical protein
MTMQHGIRAAGRQHKPQGLGLSLVLVTILAVTGCDATNAISSPNEGLKRALNSGSHSATDIVRQAGVEATRICVFGPYTTDEVIHEALRFAWASASDRTGIGSSDSDELVVAATNDAVTAWALVERPVGSSAIGPRYGCRNVG